MRPVSDRFHITGSERPRPTAGRVAHADGASAGAIGPDDVELSHWVPNRTADRYRADTSTEICLRYAADPAHDVDLVVNDHADIDGILSLYALLHPERALAHHTTLVDAAATGDFLAWPGRPGFRLAQELATLLAAADRPSDIGDCYERAFAVTTGVLDGTHPPPEVVDVGWAQLDAGCERLGRDIGVDVVGERLVAFAYPARTTVALGALLGVPALNAVVDDSLWLWPQCRNREHGERIQLVSVPHEDGWFHDVWVPAYCWAETPGRWPVPGLVSTGDSNEWRLDHAPLSHALTTLDGRESGPGTWTATDRLTPFTTLPGRRFPVVAAFVDARGRPAPSSLDAEHVAGVLASVW